MCGIWGLVRGKTMNLTAEQKFLRTCMVAGSVRGEHGAGMFLPQKETTKQSSGPTETESADSQQNGLLMPQIVKVMGCGSDLLYQPETTKALEYPSLNSAWAVVGHNRAATTGDISDETAHPFCTSPITLVHNGFFSQARSLPGVVEHRSGKVDSEYMCESMAAVGYEKALGAGEGAYALAWHDARTNVLRFARNAQRPLHFMELASGTILFASEGDMLWWAAGRAGFTRTEVRMLSTQTLLEIDSEGNAVASALKLEEPTRPFWRGWEGYNGNGYRGRSTRDGAGSSNTNPTRGMNKLKRQFDLSGASRLTFTPVSVLPHNKSMEILLGSATLIGNSTKVVDAAMYVHKKTYKIGDPPMIVRPTGVTTVRVKGSTYPCVAVIAPRETEMHKGPNGEFLTLAEWLVATSHGCTQCKKALSSSQSPEIHWMSTGQPMCPECVSDWEEYTNTRNRGYMN